MISGLLLEADYRRVSSAGEGECVSTPITSSLAGLSQRFAVVNENTRPPPHGYPLWGGSLLTVSTFSTRHTELPCVAQSHLW